VYLRIFELSVRKLFVNTKTKTVNRVPRRRV